VSRPRAARSAPCEEKIPGRSGAAFFVAEPFELVAFRDAEVGRDWATILRTYRGAVPERGTPRLSQVPWPERSPARGAPHDEGPLPVSTTPPTDTSSLLGRLEGVAAYELRLAARRQLAGPMVELVLDGDLAGLGALPGNDLMLAVPVEGGDGSFRRRYTIRQHLPGSSTLRLWIDTSAGGPGFAGLPRRRSTRSSKPWGLGGR